MFVFWYCHKRGREARLAKTSEGEKDGADDDDNIEVESTDEEDVSKSTEELLNQPDPVSVPLPESKEEEKKAI
jgi:hypothetical protein